MKRILLIVLILLAFCLANEKNPPVSAAGSGITTTNADARYMAINMPMGILTANADSRYVSPNFSGTITANLFVATARPMVYMWMGTAGQTLTSAGTSNFTTINLGYVTSEAPVSFVTGNGFVTANIGGYYSVFGNVCFQNNSGTKQGHALIAINGVSQNMNTDVVAKNPATSAPGVLPFNGRIRINAGDVVAIGVANDTDAANLIIQRCEFGMEWIKP